MRPDAFFKLYYLGAVRAGRTTGVPPLVALAQAAIESGWGDKAPGNNFHGIKAAPGWKGKRQLITTTEIHTKKGVSYPELLSIVPLPNGTFKYKVKDYFRAYDTAQESFEDHARFLQQNSRYAKAFDYEDPYQFADAIAAAGYATDPNYAALLHKVIAMLEKILKQE